MRIDFLEMRPVLRLTVPTARVAGESLHLAVRQRGFVFLAVETGLTRAFACCFVRVGIFLYMVPKNSPFLIFLTTF